MDREVLDEIRKEHSKMKALQKRIDKDLKLFPEGTLWTGRVKNGHFQYYWHRKDQRDKYPHGRYLKKEDKVLAGRLAQKEYELRIRTKLEDQMRIMQDFTENYDQEWMRKTEQEMSEGKRKLIKTFECSDEEYIKMWKEKHAGGKNPYPITDGKKTNNEEIVRSKSEKMIADKMAADGIIYSYESELVLKNKHVIYPDFTVLNLRKRKTIYYEHFGRMDDPEYCRKTIEKIAEYEQNGIRLGENLFFTMESQLKSLDMEWVGALLERYLL